MSGDNFNKLDPKIQKKNSKEFAEKSSKQNSGSLSPKNSKNSAVFRKNSVEAIPIPARLIQKKKYKIHNQSKFASQRSLNKKQSSGVIENGAETIMRNDESLLSNRIGQTPLMSEFEENKQQW